MRCHQIRPYLPGFVGGDLRSDTAEIVAGHIATCASCTAEAASLERVRAGLALVAAREVAPPAGLLDDILERTAEHTRRRVLAPVLPFAVDDVVRLVSDHKDTIASAAGVAVVAAGAAYALWRAVRGSRSAQPATS
jgi:anti-sigma factor RsiW